MWSHIGVKEDLEMKKCDGGLSNLGLVKVLLKKRPLTEMEEKMKKT